MKAAIPLLATTALALPSALWAQGTSGIAFYGHFNPAWQSVDDGGQTTDTFVDNSNSNSRFGFNVTGDLGDTGNSFLFNFETGLGFRQSGAVSQLSEPDFWDIKRTDLRKFEAIFSTGYGTFYAGQGSMASDGVVGSDFTGVGVVAGSAIGDQAGGFQFRDTGGTLSGIAISDVFKNFDGSRRFRLRYDTPQYGGFKVAAAYGIEVLTSGDDRDFYDLAVYYSDTFGDVEFAASAGYSDTSDSNAGAYAGSAGILHTPSGVSFTLIAGGADTDASYAMARLGLERTFTSWGSTAAALDYYAGQDFDTSGSDSDLWGVSFVQKIDAANMELYAGYRDYSFSDTSGTLYQDMDSWLLGARWKYDF